MKMRRGGTLCKKSLPGTFSKTPTISAAPDGRRLVQDFVNTVTYSRARVIRPRSKVATSLAILVGRASCLSFVDRQDACPTEAHKAALCQTGRLSRPGSAQQYLCHRPPSVRRHEGERQGSIFAIRFSPLLVADVLVAASAQQGYWDVGIFVWSAEERGVE